MHLGELFGKIEELVLGIGKTANSIASLKDIVRSFNLICCPAIVLIKGGKFRSMKFDPDNPEEILIREGGSVSA